MPLFSFFKSIADGVAGTAGAALCSQVPEFVQQYLQRLGGHRDEAARLLLRLRAQGAGGGDATLVATEERATELARDLQAISGADEFMRPIVFFQHIDPEIARAALDAFRPAVPLTPAGLLYAGVGLLLGIILLHLIVAPVAWLWRRRRYA